MALNKGDAACTSGLSQRIFDQWRNDPAAGFSPSMTPEQLNMLKTLCWAVAKGVVDEIVANAQVTDSGGTPTGEKVK